MKFISSWWSENLETFCHKTWRKKPLGRLKGRRENDEKTVIKDTDVECGLDWFDSEQDKAELPSTNEVSSSLEGPETLILGTLRVLFYDYVQA